MSGDTTIQALERLSHMPDSDNPADLIAGQRYYDVDFTGGTISNVILTDVTINGSVTARTERVVTGSGTVTVASDDYVITILKNTPASTAITLPESPATSRSLIIKDGAGNASTYNITIDGNGKNIDDSASIVLNKNYQSVEIIYNGTQWNQIGEFGVSGSVVGPVSSTNNAIAKWSGTSGDSLQNTGVTIDGSDIVTASGFVGPLTGNVTGNASGNAATATALQTARDINGVSFNGTASITVPAAAGTLTGTTLASNVLASSLTSVGTLTDLTVTNPIVGSVTGASGSTSGNAATATALQTARNIGGVSFNGTADITVASATGGFTVSGGNLAVGANDITCTGSLGSTGSRLTKGWFTDLQVTNAISGSVTGNAATATALQNARTIGGVSFDGTANIVPQTIESANEATDTACFPLFITASGTQQLQPKNNTGLTYNSNTNALSATSLGGTLTTAAQTNVTSLGTLTSVTVSGTTACQALVDISAAGAGQIKFPATQNASSDPNTFDDYEEGTATAVLAFGGSSTGITYSSQSFSYTKIGNSVRIRLSMTLTSKGSANGVATLTGLPFASTGNSNGFLVINANGTSWPSNSYGLTSSSSVLLRANSATGITEIVDTNFQDTTVIIWSTVYQTAT